MTHLTGFEKQARIEKILGQRYWLFRKYIIKVNEYYGNKTYHVYKLNKDYFHTFLITILSFCTLLIFSFLVVFTPNNTQTDVVYMALSGITSICFINSGLKNLKIAFYTPTERMFYSATCIGGSKFDWILDEIENKELEEQSEKEYFI